jgi:hypothetical protein
MKKYFLLASFLMANLTSIASFSLTCFQPNSRLLVSATALGDRLRFHMSAGRGYESIPQMEGPISAGDFAMLNLQSESLKEMGSGFDLDFPKSSCDLSKSSQGIFQCFAEVSLPGTHLKASSLTAYTTLQNHLFGPFAIQNFRLLIGDQNVFFFGLSFPADACTGSLGNE